MEEINVFGVVLPFKLHVYGWWLMNQCSALKWSLEIGQYLDRISGLSQSTWRSGSRALRAKAEVRSSFVSSSLFFGCLLVSRECSFILSAADLEVTPM